MWTFDPKLLPRRFFIFYTFFTTLSLIWCLVRHPEQSIGTADAPVAGLQLSKYARARDSRNMQGLEEIAKPFNTDKISVHGYHRFYNRAFAPFRHMHVRLLEIGVLEGGSLKLWTAFFPRYEKVWGLGHGADSLQSIDIPGAEIFHGDQSKKADLDNVVLRTGGDYDIIVDDGSHVPLHQVFTFLILFPHVKPGGVYIVEDIETSFWSTSGANLYGYKIDGAGVHNANSVVDFFQHMTNVVNRAYFMPEPGKFHLMAPIEHDIAAIEFGQNCIIVHKNKAASWRTLASTPYRFQGHVNKSTATAYANHVQRRLREGFPELYADGELRNSLRELYPDFGRPLDVEI